MQQMQNSNINALRSSWRSLCWQVRFLELINELVVSETDADDGGDDVEVVDDGDGGVADGEVVDDDDDGGADGEVERCLNSATALQS